MTSHQLGLDIYDTMNEKVLKISDSSIYSAVATVTCPQLLITAPGFQVSASIDPARLTQGFVLLLTACDLELQNQYCDSQHWELPDGIYAIEYSVAPNEYVKATYNHLRITKAMKRIEHLLCELDLGACIPPKDVEDRLRKIMDIRGKLLAAQASVEVCRDAEKGKIIYDYQLKQLERIDCKYCG